jgi:hypothetical protein
MTTPVAPAARPGQQRKWTILALVLAAECMDLLDGTIVNVAARRSTPGCTPALPRCSGPSAATRSRSPLA